MTSAFVSGFGVAPRRAARLCPQDTKGRWVENPISKFGHLASHCIGKQRRGGHLPAAFGKGKPRLPPNGGTNGQNSGKAPAPDMPYVRDGQYPESSECNQHRR
jgi:hypothetical protein